MEGGDDGAFVDTEIDTETNWVKDWVKDWVKGDGTDADEDSGGVGDVCVGRGGVTGGTESGSVMLSLEMMRQ